MSPDAARNCNFGLYDRSLCGGLGLLTRHCAFVSIHSRKSWMLLVLSGFATGISWLFYFRALQFGPATGRKSSTPL